MFLNDKNNELPEYASKMLSKLSILTANAASIILDRERGRKKKETSKQQNTNMNTRHRDAFAKDEYEHKTSAFGEKQHGSLFVAVF